MRAQRWGTVLNVSSVAGQSSSPGWGVYAATKHAVEAINTALHAETAPLGIRVTAIEPGPFRTDFLAHGDQRRPGSTIDDTTWAARMTQMCRSGSRERMRRMMEYQKRF